MAVVNEIRIGSEVYRLVVGQGNATHLARGIEVRALCGYDNVHWNSEDVAPSCGRCLRIASRSLVESPQDDRMEFVVSLALEVVIELGAVEVVNVPGDQVEKLRAIVRRQLRTRGFNCRTFVAHDLVVVSSSDAHDAIDPAVKELQEIRTSEAIHAIFACDDSDVPKPTLDRSHIVDWNLWG
jgi:hypothetical protein